MSCGAIAYGDAFVAGALNAADCQARSIATLGYQALATPGSSASLVLTGMLTLFVALYGYRLMLGETPSVRDGVGALARVALVLVLATSWTTYRTLAHDLVLAAPAELVAEVGGAAGLPGSQGDLATRLLYTDRALAQLGELGVGQRDSGQQVMRSRNINGRSEIVVENGSEPVSESEPIALGLSRLLFLISSVGALVMLRLVAAILLALGPLFAVFLLFDTTRGWFAGWLRGLAGTMIGLFGVTILLGVQLALIEQWVAGLLARRVGEQTITGAPVELLAATAVFAIAIFGAIAVSARVAGGFRFPDAWRAAPERAWREFETRVQQRGNAADAVREPDAERSRAAAVADAVVSVQRREADGGTPRIVSGGRMVTGNASGAAVPAATMTGVAAAANTIVPLGQSHGRRTRNRVTASAGRRDIRR